MNWIDSHDLRKWADRRDCQETLPQLTRKLIRASAPKGSIYNVRFPAGDNVAVHGWDGVMESSSQLEFIPDGFSVWEFGTQKIPKSKAELDYEKRKKDPQVDNPKESTYVFVTPRLWEKKDDWIKEKKKDNFWKDVIVLDSASLEEWLENNPTVAAWLAIQLDKLPPENIESTANFWERWATGPKLKIVPELVTGGRNDQVKMLINRTTNGALVNVRGTSREEALAFIVSSFKQNNERSEDFFARSLIVENVETFRQLCNHPDSLILIPRFDDNSSFHYATSKGHTVLVPLDATADKQDIQLPPIERESFIASLVKMGISEHLARKHSKESMRNLTILKRILGFDRTVPLWAKSENVRDIIPALLMNRWDVAYANDKTVVQMLSGETYESFEKKLPRWINSPDTPIVKIGDHWRLTSSLDAWTYAAQFVTRTDFENLRIAILKTFAEIDPALELPADKRYMAGLFNKRRTYSNWIREGQLQSLILISVFGDNLKLDLATTGATWSDAIVRDLLNNSDPDYWKSIEHHLPLIAEASPTEFLNAIDHLLSIENSPITALFDERKGLFHTGAYHVSLLWALEGIAWLPEYLSRASLVLAKLAVIDPGGNLSNRPDKCLREIFKSWHPQTLASLTDRLTVLELLLKKENEAVWKLLPSLLPHAGGVAEYTHTMRWRAFEECFRKTVTYGEIDQFCAGLIDLLLKHFNHSEEQLVILLNTSTDISVADQQKILSFIDSNLSKIQHKRNLAWHALRQILSRHRSYTDTDWTLPENILIWYQELLTKLTPDDEVEKLIWWFNESWPAFPEGMDHKKTTIDERDALMAEHRDKAAKSLVETCGLVKVLARSRHISEPFTLGFALGNLVSSSDDVTQIMRLCAGENGSVLLVQGFVIRKYNALGMKGIFELYKETAKHVDTKYLHNVFANIPPSQELWDFVDALDPIIGTEYWKNCRPHYFRNTPSERIYGIRRLIECSRLFSAIEIAARFVDELPTELIVTLLEKTARAKAIDPYNASAYHLIDVFEGLDKRKDIEHQTLIRLEWLYIGVLSEYGSTRKPKLLHDELSKSPEFFIDVLKLVYRPESEEQAIEELQGMTDEQLQQRTTHAYHLLESWKGLPGMDEHGNIDRDVLNTWVDRSRELAAGSGREGKADIYIGKLFAVIPEVADRNWPPIEVAEIIERINTPGIKESFSTGIFNKRGNFSKASYEGGVQERNLADHFKNLARMNINSFPNVAAILARLAQGYEVNAKHEDESALKENLEN